jgi:hypothetical protein
MSLLFGFASALVLAACASQGPVQLAAPATSAVAPVAPAGNAAATPTASSTTSVSAPGKAAAPARSASGQSVSVVGNRYSGTRRVVKDGVEYFCERPPSTGSHFISAKEQCYTETQLKVIRERDQAFLRRQQDQAREVNSRGSVQKTPISP